MQTQADMGIGPASCENCSVFKKGEGGPEAPGALGHSLRRARHENKNVNVNENSSDRLAFGPWVALMATEKRKRNAKPAISLPNLFSGHTKTTLVFVCPENDL